MQAATDLLTPAVEVRGVTKTFPGVRALADVSLSVAAGEVHALVGKNGAGKSTLMHVLTGLYAPDAGEIRVRGRAFARLTAAEAKAEGVRLVAQHAKFVPGLSIAENVFLGALPTSRLGFVDWPRVFREAAERIARFGLDLDVRKAMEATSVAERQMIEIARALFADASVVILDEPTAPLPKQEVARLFAFVRRQQAAGGSFIYISHYLEEIFAVADRVTALRNGRVAGAARVDEVTQADLVRLISGAAVERFRRPAATAGATALEARAVSRAGAYKDVTLSIGSGEIVGLTGLEGSGAGAFARGLFGLEPPGVGEIRIDGAPYAAATPYEALARKLAYLPRDRHGLGIVGPLSVRENTSLAALGRLSGAAGFVDRAGEARLAQTYVDALGVKTPSLETPIETLSGGNQQKVVVAKLAATEPRVLVLDEPMQGVDVQAKVDIMRIVDDLSRRGVAIAVVSDELSELMDICDRILVFHRGRIVREFAKARDEFSSEAILMAIEGETETREAR